MMNGPRAARRSSAGWGALILAGVGSGACSKSEGDAGGAWSALATCLAGSAAQQDLQARVRQIRLAELSSAPGGNAAEGYPQRCAKYANQLYDAVASAGDQPVLQRKLQDKLNCAEGKSSCAFPTEQSVVPVATELWEAAASAGLKPGAAAGVAAPTLAAEPKVSAAQWKSLSEKPMQVVGPELLADGRAVLLLKASAGRTRPTVCTFSAGLTKVTCTEANAQVPELPPQSIELVTSGGNIYASGLTENGLVAYDLASGKQTAVRGSSGALATAGVAVEPAAADGGFVAVALTQGKASKEISLPTKTPTNKPIALGEQALWTEAGDGTPELVAVSVAQGRAREIGRVSGKFLGALHTCQKGGKLAVATWDRYAGQQGAKPNAGADGTQLAFSVYADGKWSKASDAVIPFNRSAESDLVCTADGASMTWARRVEGTLQVGRVDCSAEGCKTSDVKLPGVESKWLSAVGPLGDKVLVLWRGALGETRLRVAPLASLASAADVLVFDSAEYGGPTPGEATTLVADDAALLVFKSGKPVALRLGADGSAQVVAP